MLEWRWIFLTIIYKTECSRGEFDADDSKLKSEVILLMFDLLQLSIAKFNNGTALDHSISVYPCSCVKELWNLLENFIQEMGVDLNFWEIMTGFLCHQTNPYENFPTKKILQRSSNRFLTCKCFDKFSIWMVCGLVKSVDKSDVNASSLRESYELLERLIKKYLNSEPTEENLRAVLFIISEVIIDCSTRSNVLMAFWEIFQRKINSTFSVAGQSLSFGTTSPISSVSLLEKIKSQQTRIIKHNSNLTSYDMFVQLLGKMVKKSTTDGENIQVQKILSRIYTKFPTNKLQQLVEPGIHNILNLFLTLSVSTNFQDISKKISETLLSVRLEKFNRIQQVSKFMIGHMAFIIIYVENSMDFTNYLMKLMPQINLLIEKSSGSIKPVLKIMAEAFPVIMTQNVERYDNGELLLIDSWIVEYLKSASLSEQDRLFEAFIKILQKIRSHRESDNVNIVKKIVRILLPFSKKAFEKTESVWLPSMVAHLCLITANYQNQTFDEMPKHETILKNFLESNCIKIESGIKFLLVILENCDRTMHLDKVVIIQYWIKSCVLLSRDNVYLKEFTLNVIKFDEIVKLSDTAQNHPENFLNSKEPVETFLIDLRKKYSNADNQKKLELIEKVHSYFLNFDKWALPIVQSHHQTPGNRSQTLTSTDESIMRIYSFISRAIFHSSELIYIRSKSLCFFNVAISNFILPSKLLMGQSQPRPVVVSMHKVWPLLIEGISNLDYNSDHHVRKTLMDLIVKWAPLLKITENSKVVAKPFLKITDSSNTDMIELVYRELAKSYIGLKNRKSNPSPMILTVVEEVLHVIEGDEKKSMMIWKGMMIHVIEAAMMSDEKAPSYLTCYNLLERFFQNKNFPTSQEMKNLAIDNLRKVTLSHLSYNSVPYFR